jgi:hypothetical protein
MKNQLVVVVAALLASPAAFAGDMPKGQVGGYVTSEAYEADFDAGGTADDDGTGFGVRGWFGMPNGVFFHGEWQTVSMDADDFDQMRIGGGYAKSINDTMGWLAKGEYIALDNGSGVDQTGFGVHGGLHGHVNKFGWFATGGLLSLEDGDGFEVNGGVSFDFTPALAGVVDVRSFAGSFETAGVDYDLALVDFRVGLNYSFR